MTAEFWTLFFLNAIGILTIYLKEKAKNQATKEDITAITKKIEEAKVEFTSQNEKLKSQLSLIGQHAINMKKAEIEAIFDYNKCVTSYLISLQDFDLSNYTFYNYKELTEFKRDIKFLDKAVTTAYSHLLLFLRNDEFKSIQGKFDALLIKCGTLIDDGINRLATIYSISENIQSGLPSEPEKAMEVKRVEEVAISSKKDTMRNTEALTSSLFKAHNNLLDYLTNRLKKIEE